MTTTRALRLVSGSVVAEVIENVIADKSPETQRKYTQRLRHFATWLRSQERKTIDKRTIAAYRRHLLDEGKSASTVNGHLVAVRSLLIEAAEMDLLDARQAERAAGVEGVKQRGERLGNWLSKREAQRLLDVVDVDTLKGKRDLAILGVLLFCGLRRSELAGVRCGQLQQREGHDVVADINGKHGRVRTVKLPVAVRRVIDVWLDASGRKLRDDALVFVAIRKGGHLAEGESITAQALYNLVKEYGAAISRPELTPHDLRRTFAKLARQGQAALEEISLTLGHASLETTQRYLQMEVNLDDSAPDRVGLRLAADGQRMPAANG